jgi:glucoamylase
VAVRQSRSRQRCPDLRIAAARGLGLGFGSSAQAAATLAISSLMQPFAGPLGRQIADWGEWLERGAERASLKQTAAAEFADQLMLSSMVLRAHRDKTYPGAMIASLSVPWGNSRDDRGGYHLVWPRDLVHRAGTITPPPDRHRQP